MYLMAGSEYYPEAYWLAYDSGKFPDLLRLTDGIWVDAEEYSEAYFFTQSRLSIKNLLTYDYLSTVVTELVSERLAEILSTARENTVQLIPTKIKHKEDFYSGFYIPNYLVVKEAFDAGQCVCKPCFEDDPDGPRRFKKIVLKESDETNLIFRAKEDTGHVVVTDDLAKRIETAKLKGMAFAKGLDNYNMYSRQPVA